MKTKQIHYISGLFISIFVSLHLLNHSISIFGSEKHIAFMHVLRIVYRNIFIETILMLAIATQIVSGIKLFIKKRKIAKSFFDQIQVWSGLYLSVFLVIHLSAVFTGRIYLHLDTNFYFGVAGLNTYPYYFFFIPYYAFAIISFFAHLAAVHHKKMTRTIVGISPDKQAKIILLLSILFTIILFYGLTNHFRGVSIPEEYKVLVGNPKLP